MGYWYWMPIETTKALTQAATNRFDLPDKGYVSALGVRLSSVNAATLRAYDNTWNIQRTKTRIVGNGNVEIVNAEARHLAAMQFFETKTMPNLFLPHYSGNTQSFDELIQFGRYLGDPEYGLILENFGTGVQYEETNTFSSSYYTSGSDYLTLYALMYKEPIGGMFSKGYFKKTQIINKDAASETQYSVKLPTENKLKQIHMFFDADFSSNIRGTSFPSPVSNIWLGINGKQEYIINNMSAALLERWMSEHFGLEAETKGWAFDNTAGSGSFFETCIYHERESASHIIGSVGATNATWQEDVSSWQDSVAQMKFATHAGVAQSGQCTILNKGHALFGNLPLLLIDPRASEDQYLDAKDKGTVYVEFTEANSTGNTYIVLDELQPTYP